MTVVTIAKQQVSFSTAAAVVETAQPYTETQVWSEGGGGYVDPRFGGIVYPPQIYSCSSTLVRTRIVFGGGQKVTLILPGNVDVSPDDDVTLVYGKNPRSEKTVLAALVNHATHSSFDLASALDLGLYRPTLVQRLGRLLGGVLAWGYPLGLFVFGAIGFGIYIVLIAVLAPLLVGVLGARPGTVDLFFPPFVAAMALIAGAISGHAKAISRAQAEFRDALRGLVVASSEERAAASAPAAAAGAPQTLA